MALESKTDIEKLSITESFSSFFIKKLEKVMDISVIEENIKIMNDYKGKESFTAHLSKDIEFVLNTCFFNNSEIISPMKNLVFQKDNDIPNLYHIPMKYRRFFTKSEIISTGDIVILDKASASVVNILSPEPDEYILDMCAAPGIKTSLILDSTMDKSHILSIDFSKKRIK